MTRCDHAEFTPGCQACWLARHSGHFRELWGIAGPPEPPPAAVRGLGDDVAWLLKWTGAAWVFKSLRRGRPCRCDERRDLLNKLPSVRDALRRLFGGGGP